MKEHNLRTRIDGFLKDKRLSAKSKENVKIVYDVVKNERKLSGVERKKIQDNPSTSAIIHDIKEWAKNHDK